MDGEYTDKSLDGWVKRWMMDERGWMVGMWVEEWTNDLLSRERNGGWMDDGYGWTDGQMMGQWPGGWMDECWVKRCVGGHVGEWVMGVDGCIYTQSSTLTYTDIPRYEIIQTHNHTLSFSDDMLVAQPSFHRALCQRYLFLDPQAPRSFSWGRAEIPPNTLQPLLQEPLQGQPRGPIQPPAEPAPPEARLPVSQGCSKYSVHALCQPCHDSWRRGRSKFRAVYATFKFSLG